MQLELTEHEIQQVVAALHNWQIDSINEELYDAFVLGTGVPPMKDDEIDGLCNRLNAPIEKHRTGLAPASGAMSEDETKVAGS